VKTEVMLFVRDVEASSRWYQQLLGAHSGHGGDEYEMLVDDHMNLLFQLHRLEADEHGMEVLDETTPRGAGVLCYVQVDDVLAVHARAIAMKAAVVTTPAFNELARHTEFTLRDPDGYALAVYSKGRQS
jgi:catechol 2,3-dioxygenase-like lactoylglutathione lyase family enzyme